MSAPTDKLLNDPQHWRERAAETRSHAEQFSEKFSKVLLAVSDANARSDFSPAERS
jgi:hypothetical protein